MDFFDQPQSLAAQLVREVAQPGDVPSRAGETGDQPRSHRVGHSRDHDRRGDGCSFGGERGLGVDRDDHVDFESHQFVCESPQIVVGLSGESPLDRSVAAIFIAEVAKSFPQRFQRTQRGQARRQHTDPKHPSPRLRRCKPRPGHHDGGDGKHERSSGCDHDITRPGPPHSASAATLYAARIPGIDVHRRASRTRTHRARVICEPQGAFPLRGARSRAFLNVEDAAASRAVKALRQLNPGYRWGSVWASRQVVSREVSTSNSSTPRAKAIMIAIRRSHAATGRARLEWRSPRWQG